MTKLIELGAFTLHSGKTSDWKLEAGQFIADNLDGLAHLVRKLAGPYGSVEGIPRGGTLLAEVLLPYVTDGGPHHLIVDDILTTGGSLERAFKRGVQLSPRVVGVVVFARGPCLSWVRAVFQLPAALWLPD